MADPLPRILELLHDGDPQARRQGVELMLAFNDPDLFAVLLGQCRILRGRLELGPPLRAHGPVPRNEDRRQLLMTAIDLIGNAPAPERLPPSIDRRRVVALDLARTGTTLPDGLRGFTALQWLDLSHNQLTALPDWLGEMHTLHGLLVRNNSLAVLPEGMQRLFRLRFLDVTSNQLDAIPAWLADLPSLQEVFLDNNPITWWPAGLGRLRRLSLACTRLEQVPIDINGIAHLMLDGNAAGLGIRSRTPPESWVSMQAEAPDFPNADSLDQQRLFPPSHGASNRLEVVAPPDAETLTLSCAGRTVEIGLNERDRWAIVSDPAASRVSLQTLIDAPLAERRILWVTGHRPRTLPWSDAHARWVLLWLAADDDVAEEMAPLERQALRAGRQILSGAAAVDDFVDLKIEIESVRRQLYARLMSTYLARTLVFAHNSGYKGDPDPEIHVDTLNQIGEDFVARSGWGLSVLSEAPRAVLARTFAPTALDRRADRVVRGLLAVWFGETIFHVGNC